MITIRLEPCCKNCGFSNIDIDETDLYSDEGFYNKQVLITCKNEQICRFREDPLGRPIKPIKPIKPMKWGWGNDEHQGPKRLV